MGFMDKIWGALGLIEHDVKEDMPKTSDSADLKMKKNNKKGQFKSCSFNL